MKKVYILLAIVCMSITSISCTADSLEDNQFTQYADDDTGGQNGTLPPPPPVPPIP